MTLVPQGADGDLENADWRRWTDPIRYLGYSTPCNPHRSGRARATCTLYFIASPPYLKIGIADDVHRRLRELQAGNPHPMHIVAKRTIPACIARQVEKRLHIHFVARSVGREWFRDLDHSEAVEAALPDIRDAKLAVQRWQADGLFDWLHRY